VVDTVLDCPVECSVECPVDGCKETDVLSKLIKLVKMVVVEVTPCALFRDLEDFGGLVTFFHALIMFGFTGLAVLDVFAPIVFAPIVFTPIVFTLGVCFCVSVCESRGANTRCER